jgi:hypothetical protein
MAKNVRYAGLVAVAPRSAFLRRQPPSTLLPDVEPYPNDLVGL